MHPISIEFNLRDASDVTSDVLENTISFVNLNPMFSLEQKNGDADQNKKRYEIIMTYIFVENILKLYQENQKICNQLLNVLKITIMQIISNRYRHNKMNF